MHQEGRAHSCESSKDLKTFLAPAVLAAMVLIFFARFLITGRILLLRDLFFDWYPWRFFYQSCLSQGTFPLWNPYTGCGEPFLADIQTALFYPFNYLYLLLPVGLCTVILSAFHTFLAGIGIYLLCRLWRVSSQGSLLAAVAFCFGTRLVTRFEFFWEMASMSWYPMVLVVFAVWLKRRTIWAFLLLSGIFCLQLLAGWPEAALYTAATVMFYALFHGVSSWRTNRIFRPLLTSIIAVAGACTLAVLMAMVQLLPTWEAAQLSHRVVQDPQLHAASVNPFMVFSLLLPSVYGDPGHLGRYWAPSCYEHFLGTFYVGVVPLVILVAVGIQRWLGRAGAADTTELSKTQRASNSPVAFLLALLIFSFLYAMGKYTPLFTVLWHLVPILQKFRWPSKALICVAFSLSCLAGIGFDRLSQDNVRGERPAYPVRRFFMRWGVLVAFLALSSFMVFCLVNHGRLGIGILKRLFNLGGIIKAGFSDRVPWDTLLRDGLKLAIIGPLASVLVILYSYRSRRDLIGWLLIGLAFADVASTSSFLLHSADPKMLTTELPHLERLKPQDGTVRFLSYDETEQRCFLYGESDERLFRLLQESFGGSWSTASGVFALEQHSSFRPADVKAVLEIAKEPNPRMPRQNLSRLLRMLNCKYAVKFPDVGLYLTGKELQPSRTAEVQDFLPRAFVVGSVAILDSKQDVMETLTFDTKWDPLAVALTSRDCAGEDSFSDLFPEPVEHSCTRLDYELNKVTIEIESARAGILVLTDTYFPGWHAVVNDQEVPIYKVNAAFRGVRIKAGRNKIVMYYKPWTFTLGCSVSIITAILFLAALAYDGWRHFIRPRPPLADSGGG